MMTDTLMPRFESSDDICVASRSSTLIMLSLPLLCFLVHTNEAMVFQSAGEPTP